MKASVKLRPQASENPSAPPYLPLIRLKLPTNLLGLPLLSSASIGPAPTDPSLEVRTILPRGPSLLLSFQPPSFSLALSFGLGPLASPLHSPLSISAHLPLGHSSPPSFSLRVSARLGDFSFKRSVPLSAPSAPINPPKENGGGLHHPLPLGSRGRMRDPAWPARDLQWALLDSGVLISTSVPIASRTAVKIRWGVRLPSDAGGGGAHLGPPFLTVDKITVESVDVKEEDDVVTRKVVAEEKGGAWRSIGEEAEELRREHASIRRGIEEIRAGIFRTATTTKKKA